MKTKRIAIGLALVVSTQICSAQDLPNIVPPTPEAASIGKYGDIPIGLNTGVPQISIPLVNLKSKSMQIPVTLSYHASGIRVNEIASRVGLGWNLNTGGMIMRQVRGIPDDRTNGYFNTDNTVDSYFSSSGNEQIVLFDGAVTAKLQDYESDIYHFNFLNEQGKFYFSQNGSGTEIVIHHKDDIKIVPIVNGNGKIVGWEITNAKGEKYKFGVMLDPTKFAVENRTQTDHIQSQPLSDVSNNGLSNYIGNWYLTQITDTSGNTIDYTYQINTESDEKITYWNLVSQTKEFPPINTTPCQGYQEYLSFTKTEYSPVFLKKIESDAGHIEFEYDTSSRQDLTNDYVLKSVKLFNSQKMVDNFELKYGYFVSDEQGVDYGYPMIVSQRTKRLYLQKVEQVRPGNKNKEYTFAYHTDNILPQRLSFSQDFWGYYNGQDNAKFYPEVEINNNSHNYIITGGDRKVYPNFVNACTLKSITYPTKGKTEFIYESNTLTGEEGFYIGTKFTNKLINGGQLTNIAQQSGAEYTSNFTLSSSFPYNGIVDYAISLSTGNPCNNSAADCPKVQIFQANGTSVVHTFNTSTYTGSLNLPDGDYVLKIKNGLIPSDVTVNVSLRGRELMPNQIGNALTGGLRISKIISRDYDGTPITQKSYVYRMFDNPQLSSGLAQNAPTYVFFGIPYSGQGPTCSKNRLSSGPIFPLNGQGSSHVNYRNVTEVHGDGSEGRIEYEFRFDPDSQLNSTNTYSYGNFSYPLVPSFDYSHRRGLLLRKRVFKDGSNTPLEELQIKYSEGIPNNNNFSSVNIGMGKLGDLSGAVKYFNQSERYYKTEDILTKNEGARSLTTTTTYHYDPGYFGRAFPVGTTQKNSRGSTIETTSYYPDDVSAENSLGLPNISTEEKDVLVSLNRDNLHRVTTPVQTKTVVREEDGTIISKTLERTLYLDRNNMGEIIKPKIVQTLKGEHSATNKVQDRLIFDKYDDYGNLCELRKADGPKIAYVWGYNGEYPVIKIENAGFDTAYGAAIAALPTGYPTIDAFFYALDDIQSNNARRLELKTFNGNLRLALPNALITTYTYDTLIGITSTTDTFSDTVYYIYDEFNRLKAVQDADGKLLRDYKYSYKESSSN